MMLLAAELLPLSFHMLTVFVVYGAWLSFVGPALRVGIGTLLHRCIATKDSSECFQGHAEYDH